MSIDMDGRLVGYIEDTSALSLQGSCDLGGAEGVLY